MNYNEMDTFQIKYPTGNIYKGSVKIRIILNKTEKIRDGYGSMQYKDAYLASSRVSQPDKKF